MSACYLFHDIDYGIDGNVFFKGVKKPLYEAIPDVFPYGYTTNLEFEVWAYHAQRVRGKTHEEIETYYDG